MKCLVCRISWMETYASTQEASYSQQKYIVDKNTPYESLNFKPDNEGMYYGYVPVGGDAKGKPRAINIDKLGAKTSDGSIDGITVIFVAKPPNSGSSVVVGWYRNATVYRKQISRPDLKGKVGKIIRFRATETTLVGEDDRCFKIPKGKGYMGQANLWYGLREAKHPTLYKEVSKYIASWTDKAGLENKLSDGYTAKESKQRDDHYAIERRGNVRRFIYEKGFKCEACDWSIELADQPIWGSSFELHHLTPFSELAEGDSRQVSAESFAVLCASCHRAIHRSNYVSDVRKFREKYCKT